MSEILTTFSDGSYLRFGRGNFDDWCIYLTRPSVSNFKPFDWQYFKKLVAYSDVHGKDMLYDDFVSIYEKTTKDVSDEVFEHIKEISKKYGDDELNISIIFSILYMGMVAEENKAFTKLGKRVKRLGVFQILKESMPYNVAADFSRGMKWRELDEICKSKGF